LQEIYFLLNLDQKLLKIKKENWLETFVGENVMSSDNGIYIACFEKGFKVEEITSINNFNNITWVKYFKKSKHYKSIEEALIQALTLQTEAKNNGKKLEYGIQYIGFVPEIFQKEVNNESI